MDLARLGFAVDSSQVDKGTAALNKLTPAAQKAEAAVEGVNAAASQMGKAAASGLPGLTSNLGRVAGGASSAQSAIAGVANAYTISARAAAMAGSSMANMGHAVNATAQGHERLRAQTMAVTGALQSEINELNRVRDGLRQVVPAANGAGSALDRLGAHASDNINKMQATPGNVAAQFQDIGVTAAGGMQPLLIALQQGTQLGAAMSGGLKTLGAGILSLLSPVNLLAIGLTFGIALLIQWGMEAFNASSKTDKLSKAIDNTKLTTYAFGDAQSALATVMDITTGKITKQSSAMWGLARAQLEVIRSNALRDKAEATKAIAEGRGRNKVDISYASGGSMTAGTVALSGRDLGPNQRQSLLDRFTSGKLTSTQAIDGMEKLRKAGKLTEDQFITLTGAVSNFGMAGENLKVYEDARKALEGDKGALAQFLDPAKAPKPKKPPKPKAEKPDPWTELLKDADRQQRALEQAGDRIGLYGQDLDRVTFAQELFNKAQDEGIKITKVGTVELTAQGLELQKRAAAMAKAANDNRVLQFTTDLNKSFEDQAEALKIARGEIGLTGVALVQYRLVQEALNKAKALGITLDDAEIQRIRSRAAELALVVAANDEMTASIKRQQEQVQFARETFNGFFTDWINNVRQGQNAFTAFANAVLNALNKIIDKALDQALNGLFNASGISSLFGMSSSGIAAANTTVGATVAANPSLFAKGGAFTNTVVDSPTLFKFAKGTGMMGEAGPEAIMPLKRGADGSLGVRVTDGGGGKPQGAPQVNIQGSTYNVGGVMTPESIIAAIRQGDAQTQAELARALPALLAEYQRNGTTV